MLEIVRPASQESAWWKNIGLKELALILIFLVARLATAQNSVSVSAIEITQAVQSLSNDAPLIAGKTTLVRVYVKSDTGDIPQASGTLEGTIDASNVQTLQSNASIAISSAEPTSNAVRNNLAASLNFLLPHEWTVPAQTSFRLKSLTQANGTPIACQNCDTYKVPVTFVKVDPLRLVIIGVSYTIDQQTFAPNMNDYNAAISWLKRAYPISEIISSYRPARAEEQKIPIPFSCGDVNAALLQIRADDRPDPRTHYLAIISSAGFSAPIWGAAAGMRGCGNIAISPNPGDVASTPVFSDMGANLSLTGSDVGHELAHTFGRKHPGFCPDQDGVHDDLTYYPNGFISDTSGAPNARDYAGLDVGSTNDIATMAVLPGNQWFDLMTYCQNLWLANYTYAAIMNRLNVEGSMGPSPSAGRPLPRVGNIGSPDSAGFIHVIAIANLSNRTAVIRFVSHIPVPIGDLPSVTSEVFVIAKNEAGQMIKEYPVEVRPNSDVPPGGPAIGLIDTSIPYVAGATRLEIAFAEPNGNPSAVVSGSPIKFNKQGWLFTHELDINHLPSTEVPVSVGSSAELGPVLLKWDTSLSKKPDDLENGITRSNTRYTVQYSSDDGKSWNTIAVGLEKEEYPFEPERFLIPKGTRVTLRVIADSGFSASAVTTRKLTVQ